MEPVFWNLSLEGIKDVARSGWGMRQLKAQKFLTGIGDKW